MKILFVGRHNNDIDNMVPVAARLAESGDMEPSYFIATPEIDPATDPRLAWLKKTFPVIPIHEVLNILPVGIRTKACRAVWRKKSFLPRKLPHAGTPWLLRAVDWKDCINRFMDRLQPDVVAFDWVNVHHVDDRNRPPYGLREIAEWALRNKRPIVALPHGLLLFALGGDDKPYYNTFSKVFVESARRKEMLLASGVEAARIEAAGSPRYDPWWLKKLYAEINPASRPVDGLVITFFATKMVYSYDFGNLIRWLKRLASGKGVSLIVQPHPRGQKARQFRELGCCPNVTIDATTPATVLIGRSHAVSTLVSSVVVDAMCRDIPVLYPKFLHQVTTWFEEWDACLTLKSMEETEAAVERLREGWTPAPAALGGFLREEVYGGGTPDTVDRIISKIKNASAIAVNAGTAEVEACKGIQ